MDRIEAQIHSTRGKINTTSGGTNTLRLKHTPEVETSAQRHSRSADTEKHVKNTPYIHTSKNSNKIWTKNRPNTKPLPLQGGHNPTTPNKTPTMATN
jgi:hypothetical protein